MRRGPEVWGRGRGDRDRVAADILLLTASLGRGHRTVALALAEALAARRPGLRIATTDEAEILGPALHRLIRDGYAFSLRYWRAAFQWFYTGTARLAPGSWLHRGLHGLGQRRLLAILRRHRPRLAVCTFPEQAGTLSALRRHGLWSGATAVVLTDHAAHSQWVHPGVDLYCAPSAAVATALWALGCPPDAVAVTGIPVRRAFRELPDGRVVRADLGLDPTLPTVVITPGAFDEARSVIAACRAVAALPLPVQAVAVAGSRRAARRVARAVRGQRNIRVFGYVRNMARLFAAADVLVGKAGGATTAEACCAGLAMVLSPAPGQERENAFRLAEGGAAVIAADASSLVAHLERTLAAPATVGAMRAAALRLAAPDAALAAADRILALLDRTRGTAGPEAPRAQARPADAASVLRATVTNPSGARGSACGRTPVAARIALAIAGAIAMIGVSPPPAEGTSGRSMRMTSIGGTSPSLGTR